MEWLKTKYGTWINLELFSRIFIYVYSGKYQVTGECPYFNNEEESEEYQVVISEYDSREEAQISLNNLMEFYISKKNKM